MRRRKDFGAGRTSFRPLHLRVLTRNINGANCKNTQALVRTTCLDCPERFFVEKPMVLLKNTAKVPW
jgi:hypothetical protein